MRWPFRRSVEEPAPPSEAPAEPEAPLTLAWWFAGGAHSRGAAEVGATERVAGAPRVGHHGVHASRSVLSALAHAQTPTLCRVRLDGEIAESGDQLAAAERTVLSVHDVRGPLRELLVIWIARALSAAGEPGELDADPRRAAERARERAILAEDRARDAAWVLEEGAGRREGDARSRALGIVSGARFALHEARAAAYANEAAAALGSDLPSLARAAGLVTDALAELESDGAVVRARLDQELERAVLDAPPPPPEPARDQRDGVASSVHPRDTELEQVKPVVPLEPGPIVLAAAFSSITLEPPEPVVVRRVIAPLRRDEAPEADLVQKNDLRSQARVESVYEPTPRPRWALAIHDLCERYGAVRAWAIGGDPQLAEDLANAGIAPVSIAVHGWERSAGLKEGADKDGALDRFGLGVAISDEHGAYGRLSVEDLELDHRLSRALSLSARAALASRIDECRFDLDLTRTVMWDNVDHIEMELRWILWTSKHPRRASWVELTDESFPLQVHGPKLLAVWTRSDAHTQALEKAIAKRFPDIGVVQACHATGNLGVGPIPRLKSNARALEIVVRYGSLGDRLAVALESPDVYAHEWMLARPRRSAR